MIFAVFSVVFGMIAVAAFTTAVYYGKTVFGVVGALFTALTITTLLVTGVLFDNARAKERIATYNQLGIEAVNEDDYTGKQLKEMCKVSTLDGIYYFDLDSYVFKNDTN